MTDGILRHFCIDSGVNSVFRTDSMGSKAGVRKYHKPCTHRETLREPGMLITQGCLLNEGDKNQTPAFCPES